MQASVMPRLVRQSRRLRLSPAVTLCFSAARRVHIPATELPPATKLPQGSHVKDIRNIGIIAHVDAVSLEHPSQAERP